MSDDAQNLDLHFFLAHFPADGSAPDEGTAKAVDGLAAGATRCGAHVTVVCEGDKPACVRSSRGGYNITCLTRGGAERYIDGLNGRTLFVLNGMFHPRVYAISKLLSRRGIDYVNAPHDPYAPAIFARRAHLKWPYWYLRERPMLRRAAAVQVLDDRHGQYLKNLGVQTPVISTSNGFAPEDVCPEESLRWSSPTEPPKLVFLGRLDSFNKGLDLLIEAVAKLDRRHQVKLTIQGPDWGDAAGLKSLPAASSVTFMAPDYTRRPWQIILEHDVFCLTSRFEGFGLSALEAMLAARVLIVPEVAGIAPHVRAAGCGMVIEADARSIQSGVEQLLASRARWKEMGMAGRDYALRHLEWGRIARQAIEDYRKLKSQ
jgi:glycosyltransferase involved in cell wall biosynthesis